MKRIGLSAGLFLSLTSSLYALDLGEAIPLLKLTNEEIVARNFDDRQVVVLVEMVEQNQIPNLENLDQAMRYCEDVIVKIGTSRLRKKMLKQIMGTLDEQILWVVDHRPLPNEFDGRKLSAKLRKRLQLLLEFEADRYREFLKILNTVQAPR